MSHTQFKPDLLCRLLHLSNQPHLDRSVCVCLSKFGAKSNQTTTTNPVLRRDTAVHFPPPLCGGCLCVLNPSFFLWKSLPLFGAASSTPTMPSSSSSSSSRPSWLTVVAAACAAHLFFLSHSVLAETGGGAAAAATEQETHRITQAPPTQHHLDHPVLEQVESSSSSLLRRPRRVLLDVLSFVEERPSTSNNKLVHSRHNSHPHNEFFLEQPHGSDKHVRGGGRSSSATTDVVSLLLHPRRTLKKSSSKSSSSDDCHEEDVLFFGGCNGGGSFSLSMSMPSPPHHPPAQPTPPRPPAMPTTPTVPTPLPPPAPLAPSVATLPPASAPSSSGGNCAGLSREEAFLSVLSTVTPSVILLVPATPQGVAFQWIVNENPTPIGPNPCDDPTATIQRYVLATLYYSTNGDEWIDTSNWLSSDTECVWAGVECDDTTRAVTSIELGTYCTRERKWIQETTSS